MKPIKAWAVVLPSGDIRDVEGLCVFKVNSVQAKRYLATGRLIRVEIRELPRKVKR